MITFYKEKIAGIFSGKNGRKDIAVPIENADYIVIDTELTGLNPKKDSIISIGAVKMHGGSIDLGNTFYKLINPSTEISHESVVVHGITPSDVAEKPPIDKVICELIDFCGKDILVGHFLLLDMSFINRDMKRICGTPLNNRTVDTHRIYEWLKSNESSAGQYNGKTEDLDLFALAREYNIPVSEAHNALSDAFMTAQLFQRFLSILPGHGVKTVGDLFIIGKP